MYGEHLQEYTEWGHRFYSLVTTDFCLVGVTGLGNNNALKKNKLSETDSWIWNI